MSDAVYKSNIWTYGNIELHFHEQELFLIFSDYIETLNGGSKLELNRWFLRDVSEINLVSVLEHLHRAHIDYRKSSSSAGELCVFLDLSSGVRLSFALQELENESSKEYAERSRSTNQNEFVMRSFSLMAQ